MGKVYNHHNIQHHHFQQKNIFLPIFCRLSLKDINLNNNHTRNQIPTDEPSSPKVSCMGQVKRNNRVIGFPTTTTANHHHKYTKLKKFFSSKNLLPPAPNIPSTTIVAAAGAARSGSKSCRTSKDMCERRLRLSDESDRNNGDGRDCGKVLVNIGEMDPPLPVVKKVAPPGIGGGVNIWKRRFNGSGLNGLQIEQIHLPNLPNYEFQTPPTV